MDLTGKCKEDFEAWYVDWAYKTNYTAPLVTKAGFYDFDPAMQFGVYVLFFDSKGMCIEINKMHVSNYYYWMISDGAYINSYATRTAARIAVIKEANKLYNKNTK